MAKYKNSGKYVPAKAQTQKQKKYNKGRGAVIPNKFLTKGQKKHK